MENSRTCSRWTSCRHCSRLNEGQRMNQIDDRDRTAFCQSIARLQDASGAAVTTVLKIMLDPKVWAGTRLRAAEIVLTQTAKAIEIEDIDVRVAELERAARSANRSRKRPAILTWSNTDALPDPATAPALISAAPRL